VITTIPKLTSGLDSFGIRIAEKVPINTIKINTKKVVLHCINQKAKKPEVSFLLYSDPVIDTPININKQQSISFSLLLASDFNIPC